MGWFTPSSASSRHNSSSHSRPSYARSWAGSSYSSSSRNPHHSSTSRYRRSPRDGYLQHLYAKLKHFLHKLYAYARRHPLKVFFMVVMPLVSGGVLHKLARQFGVNLPDLGTGHGAGAARAGGRGGDGGYYGSEGYGRGGGGGGGMGSGMNIQSVASGIGGLASLAKMAQSFM